MVPGTVAGKKELESAAENCQPLLRLCSITNLFSVVLQPGRKTTNKSKHTAFKANNLNLIGVLLVKRRFKIFILSNLFSDYSIPKRPDFDSCKTNASHSLVFCYFLFTDDSLMIMSTGRQTFFSVSGISSFKI